MTAVITKPYHTTADNALKIHEWLTQRGGLAHWGSVDLSNPGKTWTTPRLNADGTPTAKPHYAATSEPVGFTENIADVHVTEAKEVRRFRIAIRQSGNGLSFKLTDASSLKVRRAVEKAAAHVADGQAWHGFDYDSQEAVIFVNGESKPLAQWLEARPVNG